MAEALTVSGILMAVLGLIAPVPPFLIDFFVVGNLLLAFLALILSISIKDVLQLSSFPAVLLTNTVFRICLSIAVTRSILSSGEAGDVIKIFGETLLGGNVLIGIVVYALITIVQFFVIAKGAERVAEVSARFTLDSLPGRQMSIDADVRMGVLDPDSAKQKRLELQNESRFFGALDGTMKFVKGDAIAGIFIVVVNLIGGIAVGVIYRDLDISEATAVFATLSIGEGLVSQIPSFLNGLAAGFLVSRIEREDSNGLGAKMWNQLILPVQPKFVLALICLVVAVVSPLPPALFILAATFLVTVGLVQIYVNRFTTNNQTIGFLPRLPALVTFQGKDGLKLTKLAEAFKSEVFNRYSVPLSRITCEQADFYKVLVRDKTIWSGESLDDFNPVLEEIVTAAENYLAELIDERTVYSLQSLWESHRGVNNLDQGISVFKAKEILQELLRQGVKLKPLDVALEVLFNLPGNIEVDDGVYEIRKRLMRYAADSFSDKSILMLDQEDSLGIEEMLIEGSVLPFEIVRKLRSLVNDDTNTVLITFRNTASYLRKVLNLSKTKILSLEEVPDQLDLSKIMVLKIFDDHVSASA